MNSPISSLSINLRVAPLAAPPHSFFRSLFLFLFLSRSLFLSLSFSLLFFLCVVAKSGQARSTLYTYPYKQKEEWDLLAGAMMQRDEDMK